MRVYAKSSPSHTHSLTSFTQSLTHTLVNRRSLTLRTPKTPLRSIAGERHEGALALVWSAAARATMTSTTELKNSIQMKLEQTGEYDR
jgi:hypothetical protein